MIYEKLIIDHIAADTILTAMLNSYGFGYLSEEEAIPSYLILYPISENQINDIESSSIRIQFQIVAENRTIARQIEEQIRSTFSLFSTSNTTVNIYGCFFDNRTEYSDPDTNVFIINIDFMLNIGTV